MKKLILVTALLLTVNAANASAVYDKYTGAVNVNGTVMYPKVAQSITYDYNAGVVTAKYVYTDYDCHQDRRVVRRPVQQVNASVADYKAIITAKNKPIVQKPVVQTAAVQTQVTQEDTTTYTEPTQTYEQPVQQTTQTETTVLDNAINTADTVINMINLFK